MAGAGAKKFPAFSKLTSDDVNNYLADQVIMRFATTTARDAAFGGVGEPTLAEGMTAYIDNLNIVQVYDGSNWVAIANANYPYQNPTGLELVTSCTVTSTGGTSATATNGVITVGTGNTSVTINNAFSSMYDNYKIIYSGGVGSILHNTSLQLGSASSGYFGFGSYGVFSNNTPLGIGDNNTATFRYVGGGDTSGSSVAVEIRQPFASTATYISADLNTGTSFGYYSGRYFPTTSFTACTIATDSGTITGGKIRVYGYRN